MAIEREYRDYLKEMAESKMPVVVIVGFGNLGEHMLEDMLTKNVHTVIFARHIDEKTGKEQPGVKPYLKGKQNDMVDDIISTSNEKSARNIDTSKKISIKARADIPKDFRVVFPYRQDEKRPVMSIATSNKNHLAQALKIANVVYFTIGLSETRTNTRGRDELLVENAKIIAEYAPLMKYGHNALHIVTPNPDGVIAKIYQQLSGLMEGQVFTAGSALDSLRLRREIANQIKDGSDSSVGEARVVLDDVKPAFVVGNHGADLIPLWQQTKVKNVPIRKYLRENLDFTGIKKEDHKKVIDEWLDDVRKRLVNSAKDIVDSTQQGTTAGPVAAAVELMVRSDKSYSSVGAVVPEGEFGITGRPFLGRVMYVANAKFYPDDKKMNLTKKQLKQFQESGKRQMELFNKPEIQEIIRKHKIKQKYTNMSDEFGGPEIILP